MRMFQSLASFFGSFQNFIEFPDDELFFQRSNRKGNCENFDKPRKNNINFMNLQLHPPRRGEELPEATKTLIPTHKNDILAFPDIKILMLARIAQLQQRPDYKEGLRTTYKLNKISLDTLNGLTTNKMRIFYERTQKHYQTNPEKARNSWFQNQLRLYHWLLLLESFLLNSPVQQLKEHHWQAIQAFFFPKPLTLLQFEARKLLSLGSGDLHRPWSSQECDLLRQIMGAGAQTLSATSAIKRWNDVSHQFYERSGQRWYRSNKQCREQWFNHLDHSKKQYIIILYSGEWRIEEDVLVLEFVLENGHKWAQMCRDHLFERTQHMIKNRFKSLIIRELDAKQKGGYNERKIIRKLLSKFRNTGDGHPTKQFKLKNLRTFDTSNQIMETPAQHSFPPPSQHLFNSVSPLQIISNNESSHRQNYQNQHIQPSEPALLVPSPQPTPNLCYQAQPNLFNFYPTFQKTEPQFLNLGFPTYFPTFYSPNPTALFFLPPTHQNPQ